MSTAREDLSTNSLDRRALVVVGMHRSGTSAMTRVLSLLGAALPKQLMKSHQDNPSGFWEPQCVADLNDEILQALDSDWDDVFAFRPRPYLSNFDHFYLGRAAELLEQEFNGSELIVLKDPRISVLTTFWERALKKAGYATDYVVMVRNPMEVAESLRSRDRFPREKSFLLWCSYMIAVERDTRAATRLFVSYDQLMKDWRTVRRRIEEASGMPFPRDTAAAAIEIDRYLDPKLRHHETPAEDLFSSADVPDELKSLFRMFLNACDGAEIDLQALETISARLSEIESLVGPLVADLREQTRHLVKDVATLNDAHAGAREQADSFAEQLAAEQRAHEIEGQEKDRKLEELTTSLTETQGEMERRAAETEVAKARVIQLEQGIQAVESEVEEAIRTVEQRVERQIAQAAADRDRLVAEVEQAHQRTAEREAEVRDLTKEVGHLRAVSTDAQAKLAKFEQRLEEVQQEFERTIGEVEGAAERRLAQAESERVRVSTELDQANATLSESESQRAQISTELEQANATLNRFRTSVSWRLTKPVRWIGRLLRTRS